MLLHLYTKAQRFYQTIIVQLGVRVVIFWKKVRACDAVFVFFLFVFKLLMRLPFLCQYFSTRGRSSTGTYILNWIFQKIPLLKCIENVFMFILKFYKVSQSFKLYFGSYCQCKEIANIIKFYCKYSIYSNTQQIYRCVFIIWDHNLLYLLCALFLNPAQATKATERNQQKMNKTIKCNWLFS